MASRLDALLDKDNELDSVAENRNATKKKTTVSKIVKDGSEKDKQISGKVNSVVYEQFTRINKMQGISNNSALNMVISKYVRENKGILESEE